MMSSYKAFMVIQKRNITKTVGGILMRLRMVDPEWRLSVIECVGTILLGPFKLSLARSTDSR